MLAALVASSGDFDLAEEAFQDAVEIALERWPREGVPRRPAAWLTTTRAPARDRSPAPRRDAREQERLLREQRARAPRRARGGARGRGVERARRAAAADLHVLPSRARARVARRADAAHARRALHRGRRALLPRARGDDGAAARAREAQDPRRADPVPRAAARRVERADAIGARRGLPDLQRGLQRDRCEPPRIAAPSARRRSGWRGCWPRSCPTRARCARSARSCCCTMRAAMRVSAPTARSYRSTNRTARAGTARARARARGPAPRRALRRSRALPGAGRDRGRARRRASGAEHAVAGDRRALRRARALLPVPGRARESRGRGEPRGAAPSAGLALLEPLALDARSHARLDAYQPYHAARADLLREAGRAAEARAAYAPRDRAVPR